jgi:conjugative relaxase-like TrwC/TraI family protein
VPLVLRVAKIRSGSGTYYLEVAEGSGTGIEAAGRWLDSGAHPFELSGTVDPDAFEAVLAGQDPTTGRILGSARHQVTVAGFDMTFSAPKSVSLLHALSEPDVAEAVAGAHGDAVDAAMSYVERHALAVRRRTDTSFPVPTDVEAVAAAGFVHRMSRALDPHLHTHVVVANLGRDPDGAWSALDGRGVYAHAPATEALYHSHLRHELTRRLGVTWNPLDRGRADVAGIAPEARREFSRRSAEIAIHLAERDMTGARAQTVAAHVTRADKDLHLSADDLRPQWKDRAQAVGLGPRRLESVLDRTPRVALSQTSALEGSEFPSAVGEALEDLRRPVSRRDVVRAWGRSLSGGAPVPEVEEAADAVLHYLSPEPGWRGARHGPGVAERSHDIDARVLERGLAATVGRERKERSRLLAGRGIGRSQSGRQELGLDRD